MGGDPEGVENAQGFLGKEDTSAALKRVKGF